MDDDTTILERRHALHEGAVRLHGEFAGVFGKETIGRLLADSLQRLEQARYETFVPVLAERFTRERLRAVARIEELRTGTAPRVLFLCVHNAGRSQMAAGWMSHLAGPHVEVSSGGSAPAERINPAVVEAMAEVGIDIATDFPKPWTEEILGAADVIVTMGCGDACPVMPGKRYLDWELDDPVGKDLHEVRPIRDDIEQRVRALLDELAAAAVR